MFYALKVDLQNQVLGSQPGKDTPASDYLAKKMRDEHPEIEVPAEEVNSLPEELEKGTTGFFRQTIAGEEWACLRGYQIKGMLKEAANDLNGLGGVKMLRDKISKCLRVKEDYIPLCKASELTICERPLRAMTMQGPRVSLSRSEMSPAGLSFTVNIEVRELPKFKLETEVLEQIVAAAEWLGIGQWRNSDVYGKCKLTLAKTK